MPRQFTFQTPKKIDPFTTLSGGELDFIKINVASIDPHMSGGRLSDTIPLDGLLPADRILAENFIAMVLRELETGAAKGRSALNRIP